MKTLLLLIALFEVSLTLRDQSVAIKGSLRCHLLPLSNKTVELYEKRTKPLRDQKLASNITDAKGDFVLVGAANRLLPITPLLKIPLDCSGKEVKIKLNIVKSAVTKGKVPKAVVDIGIVNLDILQKPVTNSVDENIPYIDVDAK